MMSTAKAVDFARQAHEGQTRKYTREDFIWHPTRVAMRVATVTNDPEILAAAMLHDVVEDTPVEIEEIETQFGERVANLVFCLSDVATRADGNRAARNLKNVRHYECAHPDAKTIKLADMLDNIPSIISHDPKFAKVYLPEKKMLLEVLSNGHPELYQRVEILIKYYFSEIGN